MGELDEVSEKKGMREKLIAIATITVLLAIAFGLVIGFYFFGFAGLFNLFDVKYDTLFTILTFILFVLIIGIFTDILAKVPRIIFSRFLTGKYTLIVCAIMIEAFFSWIAIFTADELLTGLNVPLTVELVAALIVSIAEYLLDQDDVGEK
ncbi:hypothetical protein CV093_06625 [Oceanobacillus sp. 143]|uniref:Regulatory protein YrvL n=1 Tax=Oceanobacillus zhaokaii TaxID=2052660 RepID=A0A345PEX1_9BACI|nr:YrvL family regulatory protein [Oceanobacillus zhaokaii]AXI08551.1 hypothetical protein CUC15_06300 [Oceanobacillus zhaokaii]QGS68369.1 hypothetical protein CV093_06625 [Oceanobacillus sp. 143]